MPKPYRSPASGPRHQFSPKTSQQSLRLPGTIFALAIAFAFIFFGPELSNIAQGPQHLLAGQVKAPFLHQPGSPDISFTDLTLEVFADVNQNGRVDEADLLSGVSPVHQDGRFRLEIIHGQSFLMAGSAISADKEKVQRFRFLPPSLPKDAVIQDLSLQLAFNPKSHGVVNSTLKRAGQAPLEILFEASAGQPSQSIQNQELEAWWAAYQENPESFELALELATSSQTFPGPLPAPKLIVHYNLPPTPYLIRIQPESLPANYFHDPVQLSFGDHPQILLHCKPYQVSNRDFPPGAFTASWVKNEVILQWSVDSILPEAHFEIMYSANGIDFERIGSLPAQQGFPGEKQFEFRDYLPRVEDHDVISYRIKMLKPTGQVAFSETKSVNVPVSFQGLSLDIAQDSISGEAWARYQVFSEGPTELQVLDGAGELVYKQALPLSWVAASHPLPTADWARGTYYVQVRQGNQAVVQRLHLK